MFCSKLILTDEILLANLPASSAQYHAAKQTIYVAPLVEKTAFTVSLVKLYNIITKRNCQKIKPIFVIWNRIIGGAWLERANYYRNCRKGGCFFNIKRQFIPRLCTPERHSLQIRTLQVFILRTRLLTVALHNYIFMSHEKFFLISSKVPKIASLTVRKTK